jgi:hypothetical protein
MRTKSVEYQCFTVHSSCNRTIHTPGTYTLQSCQNDNLAQRVPALTQEARQSLWTYPVASDSLRWRGNSIDERKTGSRGCPPCGLAAQITLLPERNGETNTSIGWEKLFPAFNPHYPIGRTELRKDSKQTRTLQDAGARLCHHRRSLWYQIEEENSCKPARRFTSAF